MKRYVVWNIAAAAHFRNAELIHMFAGTRSQPEFVPLSNAVFCLDCEVISNGRCDECPACNSRSVVSLARMIGGSLGSQEQRSQEHDGVSFKVTITVELQQMYANELNMIFKGLSDVIEPRLVTGRASIHMNVVPTGDNSLPQTSRRGPGES